MARLSDDNVVGTFADLASSRAALKALGDTGIDADDVSLLGKQVEEATSNPDTRLRDLDSTTDLAKKSGTGAAAGSVIGGIAGAAAFAIPGIGPVIGLGIFAAAAGGAIAGSVVGGMVGAIEATELGPEWEVTYGHPLREGKVLLAVHARDDEEAASAEKVLREHGAEQITHIGADGKPLGGDQG
jgi:outer membrane lipoprotein SlyB